MNDFWTPEEEAMHLHARFNGLKTRGIGQAEFARKHQIAGGSSMLSQHIKGRRPLDIKAATAYAKGFGCSIKDISPRLADEVLEAVATMAATNLTGDGHGVRYSPQSLLLAAWLDDVEDAGVRAGLLRACGQLILRAQQSAPPQPSLGIAPAESSKTPYG